MNQKLRKRSKEVMSEGWEEERAMLHDQKRRMKFQFENEQKELTIKFEQKNA